MKAGLMPSEVSALLDERPVSVAKFYNPLYQYEAKIPSSAQMTEWRTSRRDFWVNEMKSDRCDIAHAATMLLAVEGHVLQQAQVSSWTSTGGTRSEWVRRLQSLGCW
jgi:hypothetical protein